MTIKNRPRNFECLHKTHVNCTHLCHNARVATFLSYINKKRDLLWQAEANFCIVDVNTYNADHSQNRLYDQATQDSDLQAFWQPKNDWSVGLGLTFSNVNYTPRLASGLPEGGLFCASAASLKTGLQYNLVGNLFLKPQLNGLLYDFVRSNGGRNEAKTALGCSVTCGYKTFLGAIEASVMYSNLNNVILPYFNFGYALSL